MKKNYIFTLLFTLFSFHLFSQTIVSTSPENKKAIVEEGTGIHCWACPQGHAILQQKKEQYPGQVFAIKVHGGQLAWDCDPNGGHDFTNSYAVAIENLMNLNGWPSAAINRTVFAQYSDTGGTGMGRQFWSAAIDQTLQQSAYVNVGVELIPNFSNNSVDIHVEAYYTGNSPQSTNYMHVAILLDGVVGPQGSAETYNPADVVSDGPNTSYGHNEYDYLHKDILVDMYHGMSGDAISTTSSGSFIDRTYTYQVPAIYNDVAAFLTRMKVVAYVSETQSQMIVNGNGASIPYPEKDLAVVNLGGMQTVFTEPYGEEYVTARIFNYGANTISNFEVSYQLDNGDVVSETFNGSIGSWGYSDHTFSIPFDTSTWVEDQDYTINVSVSPENDTNVSDNSISKDLRLYSFCFPGSDCSFGDGMTSFSFGDISNLNSGCSPNGYGDFTDQATDLVAGDTYDMFFETGYGTQVFRVWIDYNDDLFFSLDELIVDNPVLANGSGAGTYSGTLPVTIPTNALPGEHLMRVKSNYGALVPDDACEETQYGETEDYTVNIMESLSIGEIEGAIINIFPNPSNGVFNINLNGEILIYEVANILGQVVADGKFENGDNMLDLSSNETGTYILKLTATSNGKFKLFKLVKE